ncbi:Bug family tripartite tricarboxylate transporter substrate binding protein [Roseomonas sp. BN140053]|uniref:Bug family tripartite tricarboxylate transporter substrate binding protein n=1 Tax=Roseomonas sp. BN140053 TaxID=3391898 RepID=UPI0039E959C2
MQSITSRRRLLGAGTAVLLATPRIARAQADWPNKPIRFIVPFPPGGSSDVVARLVTPVAGEQLHQSLVVENRGGAGGVIGADAIAKSAPDGYTIGIAGQGGLVVSPRLYAHRPYDPTRDLAPVTQLIESPFVIVVGRKVAARNLRELLDMAKARPGQMSIGHGGNGTLMHLSTELLNQLGGVQIMPVPYRGIAPSGAAAAGGEIEAAAVDVPVALSLIQDGTLRALAVTSRERIAVLPDTPTVAEAGVPGYETVGWFGLVAPAATPAPIITRVNAAFTTALRDPTVRRRLLEIGCEPRPTTPEQFRDIIRDESVKWNEVVEKANIRIE